MRRYPEFRICTFDWHFVLQKLPFRDETRRYEDNWHQNNPEVCSFAKTPNVNYKHPVSITELRSPDYQMASHNITVIMLIRDPAHLMVMSVRNFRIATFQACSSSKCPTPTLRPWLMSPSNHSFWLNNGSPVQHVKCHRCTSWVLLQGDAHVIVHVCYGRVKK